MRVVSLVGLLLLLPACASSLAEQEVSEQVDDSIVEYFPQEGRRWTYEAENEVIIALDRLDSARDDITEVDRMIKDTEAAIDRAGERGGKGNEVLAAELSWLETRRDQAYSEASAAEQGVLCARASLELTKAQLAIRFDLPVEEDYLEAFEAQYRDCEEQLTKAKANAEAVERQAIEAKENWRNVRSAYAKRTGDFNSGLWID